MTKLEADRNMDIEERERLENEIRMKQDEIASIKNTVDEKDEETRRLQDEMAEARRQLEVRNCKQTADKTIIFFCPSQFQQFLLLLPFAFQVQTAFLQFLYKMS